MGHYFNCLKKFAVFSGRATRKEYWIFTLVNMVITFALIGIAFSMAADSGQPSSLLMGIASIFTLIMLIPSIAALARRLHDTDKSAWWMLLLLLPLLGLLCLIFACLKGTDGENRFGPDPRGHIAN